MAHTLSCSFVKVKSDVYMMLKAAKNLEQDEFDELTFLVGKAIEAISQQLEGTSVASCASRSSTAGCD